MDRIIDKFIMLKNGIKLDGGKKKLVKEHLVQYMDALQPQVAPRRVSPAHIFKLMPMFAAGLVMLVVGGGASFAAQKALPGDALYSVKVNFNEKIEAVLQISAEAKAVHEVKLTDRRLEEAVELVARGEVNEEERAAIESRFAEHAGKAQAHIKNIEAKGRVRVAADVASRLEASLRVHKEILGKTKEKKRSGVSDIEAKVISTLGDVVGARVVLESKIAGSSTVFGNVSPGVSDAAQKKIHAAENAVSDARVYIKKKKEKVSVEAAARAEAKLGETENVIKRANEKIGAGSYGEAFNLGNEVMRVAQETEAFVGAGANFNLDFGVSHADEENEAGKEIDHASATLRGTVSATTTIGGDQEDGDRK